MKYIDRRDFLGGVLASGATLAASALPVAETPAPPQSQPAAPKPTPGAAPAHAGSAIDFRYSPVEYQTAFCFPDDKYKSLLSQSGTLLYGFDRSAEIYYFPLKVGFLLHGMTSPKAVSQKLESPAIPIVRTTLEYRGATVELTTFATNEPGEGRVDNVLFEVTSQANEPVDFEPVVDFDGSDLFDFEEKDGVLAIVYQKSRQLLMAGKVMTNRPPSADPGDSFSRGTYRGQQLTLHRGQTSKANPYRAFFRFPQAGQDAHIVAAGLAEPERLLKSCHAFWTAWQAFHAPVAWVVPGRQGEFVEACARNILQAREVRDGKLTFQVGPTVYRGLWVVDGNFILEAARYIGLDKQAIEGLRTTWAGQLSTGQVPGAGGKEHWKDTAIAMFTLVRQCELSQDWSLLHELESQVVHGLEFLRSLQALAVSQGSALGRYGLQARGFADGGIAGVRDEFTNTLWTLAGLKAMAKAAEDQHMTALNDATKLHAELQSAFAKAAPQEMRRYQAGFDYLPMLLKNDPDWELPDPWDRPRPQSAQWALSHAIFPGCVFDPQDPIVRGHVRLMQAVAQEDIPAETGWNHHHSVWAYNAAFVAEVYLWLGMRQAARDTFIGFLNHASPQYCWREEQPLQDALVLTYVGEMPHNWASAECIRYLRHMLALEDGAHLRLLAGVTAAELAPGKPFSLKGTPTRFGRLNLTLEPLDGGRGWRLKYEREPGPAPQKVSLPTSLSARAHFARIEGAHSRVEGDVVLVDAASERWAAFWTA
jgi:hypothetical protein